MIKQINTTRIVFNKSILYYNGVLEVSGFGGQFSFYKHSTELEPKYNR